jgi:hypothetical protein
LEHFRNLSGSDRVVVDGASGTWLPGWTRSSPGAYLLNLANGRGHDRFTLGAIRTKITKSVRLASRQSLKRDARMLVDMKGYGIRAPKADAGS